MGKMKEYWAEREAEWNLMDYECWCHAQKKRKRGRRVYRKKAK